MAPLGLSRKSTDCKEATHDLQAASSRKREPSYLFGCGGQANLEGRAREMAGKLHDSLHGQLLSLPPEVEVYPGHQAGSACGAGLSGKPASTIGFEKRFNPLLVAPREKSVEFSVSDIPPPPPPAMQDIMHFSLGVLN